MITSSRTTSFAADRKKSEMGIRSKLKVIVILTILGGLSLLGAVIALFLFEIEDTIYAPGVIVPEHTFEIVGHIDAPVKKFYCRMGQDVKEGDVIAELDSALYESDALAAEAAIREYEAEIEVKKAELSILEKEPLPKELWYAEMNFTESVEKNKRLIDRLKRSKRLQLVSAISKVEFEKTELDAIQSQAELARAERNIRMVRNGLGKMYIEKAKRDIELVQARMAGKKAELEFLKKRIAECRLLVPASGRIVSLPSKDTWYVSRGKVAAVIASGTRVRARAKVDARVVRKVKPGQKARVTSDVYNKLQYGEFYGVVNWIGDIPSSGDASALVSYPVEVELDSEAEEYLLKYGSGVEVAIVTGKQPAILAFLNMTDEDIARRKGNIRQDSPPSPAQKPSAASSSAPAGK